jgi:hypothetical protein
MSDILNLLKEKNQCLEKFFRINEAEIENFSAGVFDYIENFYKNREGLLQIMKKIDELIECAQENPDHVELSDLMKRAVSAELSYKNELVSRILDQDLRILSVIEVAKTKIIRELKQVRSATKVIGEQKRRPPTRLDEEA